MGGQAKTTGSGAAGGIAGPLAADRHAHPSSGTFGKAAATAAPLTLTASLRVAGTNDIAVAYGERMRLRLALQTGAQPIGGAWIYFGPGEQASTAGVDYWIGGQLEQLSMTEWQGFSGRWGAGRSAPFRILEDLRIGLSVAKLEGLGFVFKDLRLRAMQEDRRWRIDMDGPDARGSIRLPGAQPGGMLEASFTRLKVVPSARGIPERLTRAACPRSHSGARTSLMESTHWGPCGCGPARAPRA